MKLRKITVLTCILGIEICWFSAFFEMTNGLTGNRLNHFLLLITFLISWAISSLLRHLSWKKWVLTALGWISWPAVMLFMIKIQLFPDTGLKSPEWLGAIPAAFSRLSSGFEPALLILAGTPFLWMAGRRMAYLNIDFAAVIREFQFGICILLITYFISYKLEMSLSGALPTVMIFFILTLTGASLAHAGRKNSWLDTGYRSSGAGMLATGIILAAGLGFLISIIFTPDLIQLFVDGLKHLWSLIERLMAFFASLVPQPSQELTEPLPGLPSTDSSEVTDTGFSLPDWLLTGGRWVWGISVCILLALALWRIASQVFTWMRRKTDNNGAEIEYLKPGFRSQLMAWIKDLLTKFLKLKLPGKTGKESASEIITVRQLYRYFLEWTAAKGHPRQISQTPNEFRKMINENSPENHIEVDSITETYMSVRYGSETPDKNRLSELKLSLQELKKSGLRKTKP